MNDPRTAPGSPPVLHVLGCGRAARVVARWLREAGQVRLGQIVNRSLKSSRQAAEFIGEGWAVEASGLAAEPGWLLLGLPDRDLLELAALAPKRFFSRAHLAFHLSGSVGSEALAPFGVAAASVHPVRAFASPQAALAAMPGTPCVAEGDGAALERLRPAFVAAGGEWLELEHADKARYHAATVVASNGLVAMNHLARELAETAGLNPGEAERLLEHLQLSTLDTLRATPAAEALTGPVERADATACRRLLQAVDASALDRADLFRALGRATLALAVRARGDRPDDEALAALFAARLTSRED